MASTGKATIFIEPDDQYTLLIEKDGIPQSLTGNLTLSNAFNAARDTLAAMATGSEKHRRITISTRIE